MKTAWHEGYMAWHHSFSLKFRSNGVVRKNFSNFYFPESFEILDVYDQILSHTWTKCGGRGWKQQRYGPGVQTLPTFITCKRKTARQLRTMVHRRRRRTQPDWWACSPDILLASESCDAFFPYFDWLPSKDDDLFTGTRGPLPQLFIRCAFFSLTDCIERMMTYSRDSVVLFHSIRKVKACSLWPSTADKPNNLIHITDI